MSKADVYTVGYRTENICSAAHLSAQLLRGHPGQATLTECPLWGGVWQRQELCSREQQPKRNYVRAAQKVAQWIKHWTLKHEVHSSIPGIEYARAMLWFSLSVCLSLFFLSYQPISQYKKRKKRKDK